MIRALICLALMALPAGAQDFRGLLPGMPTSDLARLGEPFELETENGVTFARYPLPYERMLEVLHTDGMIVLMALSVFASTRMQLPANNGLQVGETTLQEAVALAGSGGFAYEVISSLPDLPPSSWMLSYTLAEHPDLILTLGFYGQLNPALDAAGISGASDMPQDATLISAVLIDPSIIARYSMLAELQQTSPSPDAIPFAVPLADAFPIIELPQ